MTTPIFFSKPPLISHQSSQFLTISTPNLPSFLISRPSINFQRKNATSDSTTIIDTPSVSLYSEDDDKAAVEAKIGSRVRVKVPLKVYHVPKVPEFELTGMIGVLKQYVGVWKGKRISANFPYKIEFVTEIEGRKGPVKFFAHLREDEFDGGSTSQYVRKAEPAIDIPLEHFPQPSGYNAPEQVHITQGDHVGRGVIISWVTPLERHPNVVTYWEDGKQDEKHKIHSITTFYRYYNYSSGYIHHATIKKVNNVTRRFSLTTPPKVGPDVPYTFGIMGDLGQTYASKQKNILLSSHICIGTMYPTGHLRVHPPFGILLSVHRHISLCYLLTLPMVNILHNTNGLSKSSPRLTGPRHHG
ncbi:unnamed protein product [Ilex paraguariensis]|uniref:Ferredoxin thioredoxin reductase alpha chain domain-containing protein n=1 Tax=Ilex paraguariensis TaxID=185542 RepID=A0ABC8URI9_9AQUA